MCPEFQELTPSTKEYDPIAQAAQLLFKNLYREQLPRKESPLIIIEVFQGEVRSNPHQENQHLIITCKSLSQAKRLKKALSNFPHVSFVVANPHSLPFKKEAAKGIVDPHEVTHVAYDQESLQQKRVAEKLSPTLGQSNYSSLPERLIQFAKEILFLTGVPNISRPIYFTKENHETMKKLFRQTLQNRVKILGENGRLLISVAAARPGKKSEEEYWAIHHQEGEIVLSKEELDEIITQTGLKIEKILPGMAPKTQTVAVESAFKALLMTILGGEKFKDFMLEKFIPLAHKSLQKIHEVLPKQKGLEAKKSSSLLKPTGIGSRFQAPPDRFIVIATKK